MYILRSLYFLLLGLQCLISIEDPFDRIIGGEDAKLGEFPWQGSFRKYNFHFCGAAIIREQWVLTAAHCTDGMTTNAVTIVAGGLKTKEDEPTEQIVDVEAFYQHKDYNNKTFENDISLLKMAQPFTFNSYVNTVSLPKQKGQAYSGNCNVTGWGFITPSYPESLQKVSIPLMSHDECQSRFTEDKVFDSMLCAWAKGKDSCYGDSGGPMVCKGKDDKSYLAGLTSWGIDCASDIYPGVYTDVSYFLDWINETIESHS